MNQISPMAFIVTAIFVSILIASLVTLMIRRRIARKKPEAEKPPPAIPAPEEKPKSYTYEEFARDFSNENVSIDDLLKRYSGAEIPPKPEEPKKEPEKPEKPPRDLVSERQAWFARASEKQNKLKIVPPPIPQVVVAIKGITVPCPGCKESMHFSGYSSPNPTWKKPKCEKCNGMGVIVIVGGK